MNLYYYRRMLYWRYCRIMRLKMIENVNSKLFTGDVG